MRRSVLLPLLVFGFVAVLAILVPTLGFIADARTQQLILSRQAAVDHLVQLAQSAIEDDSRTVLQEQLDRHREVFDESVLVVDLAGGVVAATGRIDPEREAVGDVIAAATMNVPQWDFETILPWGSASELVAQPVLGSAELSIGAVLLEPRTADAQGDIAVAWSVVVSIGAALLAGLAVIALRWTSSVLRPVRALDEAASVFPAHRDLGDAARTGPPELRALTRSILRMTESMEQSLAQQQEFVADASHHLRNPLAAIRLRIDALRDEHQQDDEIEMLDEDTERMEQIVDRMLNLAGVEHRVNRAESGAEPPGDRVRVIRSAEALVSPSQHLHERAGQRLVARGGEVSVRCVLSDLEEMLENALGNARKYAGRGATVTVRLRSADGWTEIIISDDGPGLDEDELRQAGQRFWRAEEHRSRPGTGLGLAILSGLARVNGGEARFDRAPEGGLRIRIILRSGDA